MMDHTTRRNIDYLDRYVPLRGASHADVISYAVDIPMRYAEFRADLTGGCATRLANKLQFLGRSGHAAGSAMLFVCDQDLIVLRSAAQSIAARLRAWHREKFIGVDGDLLEVGRWRVMELSLEPARRRHIPNFQPKLAIGLPH